MSKTYDELALELLIDGQPPGGPRLRALLKHASGDPCNRCGCTSYHRYDDHLECDHCGLMKGADPEE